MNYNQRMEIFQRARASWYPLQRPILYFEVAELIAEDFGILQSDPWLWQTAFEVWDDLTPTQRELYSLAVVWE